MIRIYELNDNSEWGYVAKIDPDKGEVLEDKSETNKYINGLEGEDILNYPEHLINRFDGTYTRAVNFNDKDPDDNING